jgi:hypothetical protein
MPQWLKDIIVAVVRELVSKELLKHGVITPDPPKDG